MFSITKSKKVTLIIFSVLILALLLCVFFYFQDIFLDSNKVLKKSYHMQIDWFIENQSEEGIFPYIIKSSNGQASFKSVNASDSATVREILALHSLSRAYTKENQNTRLKEVIEKGISYYKPYLIREEKEYQGEKIYTQRIAYQHEDYHNSTAFFLLALLEFVKGEPTEEKEYQNLIYELGNYLITTQLPSGGFSYRPNDEKENSYNNGETLYALTKLSAYSRNKRYQIPSEQAAGYFSQTYSQYNNGFYIWGMYSFHELYQLTQKKEYWDFMKDQTNQYLTLQGERTETYFESGIAPAPSLDAIVATEGILQTAILAKKLKEESYYKRLKKLTHSTLLYAVSYQINGPYNDYNSVYPSLTGSICLDPLCQSTRVDMTAHVISSFYNYFELDNVSEY